MLVNILISTFNGEKYLGEQLDSILSQTYSNYKIYIRDDGSTDNTCSIIKEYATKYSCINYIEGENIGYGPSFLNLLKEANEGDLWAYCDQDDVWLKDKLERGVAYFKDINTMQPEMYSGSYYIANEKLQVLGKVILKNDTHYTFQKAITECRHLGFNCMINAPLRELVLKGNINEIVTHDWWTELVVMEFGDVYEDEVCTVIHRRLNNSVSSSALKTRLHWVVKALQGNSEICNCTLHFRKEFLENMSENNRHILKLFTDYKHTVHGAIQKAFYGKRWRSMFSSEIVLRFLMLIGKI